MNTLMWMLHLLPAVAHFAGAATSSEPQSLASKVGNFKVNFHRMIEGSRVRKKRQINGPDGPSEHQMRVDNAAAVHLPYLSDYKLTFWTPLQHHSRHQVLVGTQEGHLILFQISETEDAVAHAVAVSYEEEMAIKAKAFTYLDEQWFIVLQSSRNQTWIRLYLKVGRGLEQRQSVTLDGDSDFDFVTVKGVHYMALATYQTFRNQASLRLYHWTQTQFDLIASRTVYGPRSIACWELDGALYIVLGQRMEGKDEFKYGSPVYMYNAKDNRGLVMQQMLSIYGPVKVLHFQVGSSHYVLFIGSQNAAIHWWTSNQFLLWQIIESTSHATDAAVIALATGEVVIVIALKEEVLFATLDSSGHYVVTFTISFSGYSLSSVQFMYSGKAYYALVTSSTGHAQQTYKLILKPHFFPSGSSLDSLRQCLDDVVEVLDDRQNEMNNIHVDLSRVWLKYGDQMVTAVVYVAGKVTSNRKSVVSEILVVTDRKILPDSSLEDVENGVTKANSIVNNMQQKLWTTARKSVQQTIDGLVYFQYPVYIPSMDLRCINADVLLNGVPVSRIDTRALRVAGDQVFTRPVQTFSIYGSNIETSHVNGITTNDFLLLKGKQHVHGSLEYFDIQGNDLMTHTVNSIPTDHVVTVSSHQRIEDLKSFSNIKSGAVAVHGQTNGEILRNLESQIVGITTDDEIKGRVQIKTPLHVKGDLFLLKKINGIIDLVELRDKSVKSYSVQSLTGHFSFQLPVSIQNDAFINGLVNNIHLAQLLTLSTNQNATGQYVFEELFSVQSVLNVDMMNDMKLSEVAVLKTLEPQFVSGMKTFLGDVTTDFVDMTDFVKLDGVDPSLLVQDIVKHVEGEVKQDHTVFHRARVLGNLSVVEGVNDRAVFDLPDIAWLKSKPQAVENPVFVRKLSLEDDLEASYVNAIQVDGGIVRSFGDETIISLKHFEHNVVVSDGVDVTDGAMINGMKIITFKSELDDYTEEGTVHGQKILNHLVVDGNLSPATLNNFDIFYDLIRPNEYQEVSASVTIPSELTIVQGKLKSDTVMFNTLNSKDIRSHFEDSVSRTKPKRIITNKAFSSIEATALSLPQPNSINSIPISWLFGRLATLNSPQDFLSDATFTGNLKAPRLTISGLNGREIFLEEVVLLDQTGPVASKEFVGAFKVSNVSVKNPITGIDLGELNRNAIDKSRESNIKMPVVFMNNVEVGKLITGSKVDETIWDGLIFTQKDEAVGSLWLVSDAHFLSNIFAAGLVNDCDLLQLQQRAMYSNKTSQVIQEDVTIESIEIQGNVKIEDVVNDVKVTELLKTLILTTGDQAIASDVVLQVGTRAARINVAGTADVKLSYVITDAVKRSQPQVIGGTKKFRTFQTNVLHTDNLFISGHMGLVDVTSLFSGIVLKQGDQLIEGEKILASLKADVATVEGHLNGLSLPNDVVKTDATEVIFTPIFFMSDVILAADLSVHGSVDGTNVSDLVRSRVTLMTDQEVFSNLTFLSRVKTLGDLHIDGTLNHLVLDLIVKTSKNLPIDSYKVFIQDLTVDGKLDTSSVNRYKIQTLDQNILKRDEEEFIKDVQTFEKPVMTSHLFADWINSLSLTDIASTFISLVSHLNETLHYFKTLSSGFLQQLTRQVDTVTDRISKFAYFVLLQEINLGPTMKILQGYRLEHSTSEFSHSMVIWTSRKRCSYLEKCCHEEFTHWVRVKRSGHLMIDSQPEQGRLYPIHNPDPVTTDRDFFIWTNATDYQPKWCGATKDEKMLLASFTDLQFLEVFMDIRSSPTLSDIKSFRRGYLYAVAGFYYDKKENKYSNAVVYKFNEILREWTTHQILPSHGVLSLDVTSYVLATGDELLLAVGTGDTSASSVYKWDDGEHKFSLVQNIPSTHVTSTMWLTHGPVQMLAMASVEVWPSRDSFCSGLVEGGGVNVYTYNGDVRWIQNIPLSGVVSLVHFTWHGDTFLAAASIKLQTVYIYEWKGYAGFSLIQSMFVGEVTHLNTYRIADDLYVTVATVTGPAKVLKVAVQGQHKVTEALGKEPSFDTLKDEAEKDQKTTC